MPNQPIKVRQFNFTDGSLGRCFFVHSNDITSHFQNDNGNRLRTIAGMYTWDMLLPYKTSFVLEF